MSRRRVVDLWRNPILLNLVTRAKPRVAPDYKHTRIYTPRVENRFDMGQLPADIQRIYKELEQRFGLWSCTRLCVTTRIPILQLRRAQVLGCKCKV